MEEVELTSTQKAIVNWKKRNPEKVKEHTRRGKLKANFGITIEEYDEMLYWQGGCCAICAKPQDTFVRKFAVDHNHTTGKIRGLLCVNCNTAIGKLDDDVVLLERAISYLERSNG